MKNNPWIVVSIVLTGIVGFIFGQQEPGTVEAEEQSIHYEMMWSPEDAWGSGYRLTKYDLSGKTARIYEYADTDEFDYLNATREEWEEYEKKLFPDMEKEQELIDQLEGFFVAMAQNKITMSEFQKLRFMAYSQFRTVRYEWNLLTTTSLP